MALTTILPASLQNENFSDQTVTYTRNGLSQDVNSVQFPLQVGVPVSPIYTFKVIPVTSTALAVANNYSPGTGTAGFSLPLVTTVQGTAPNIASVPYTFNGATGVLLDCERCVQWYMSTPATQAFTVTITGYDYRGVYISWKSPTISVGVGSGFFPPISLVTSITFSSNPLVGVGGLIAAAPQDSIGLPYYLPRAQYVINATWDGNPLSTDGSTITYGYAWRSLASTSSFLTARGMVNIGSDNPDGSKMLCVTYYVYGADSEINSEIINQNQSSLKLVSVQKTASSSYPTPPALTPVPKFVYPYLVPQDLTGVQINGNATLAAGLGGDNAFMANYQALCAS